MKITERMLDAAAAAGAHDAETQTTRDLTGWNNAEIAQYRISKNQRENVMRHRGLID